MEIAGILAVALLTFGTLSIKVTHTINLPNGSTALGNNTSDDLWWDGESNARIFAPSSWNGGSSFSHLRENTYGSGGINSDDSIYQ